MECGPFRWTQSPRGATDCGGWRHEDVRTYEKPDVPTRGKADVLMKGKTDVLTRGKVRAT